ncbi:MAG: hypothetical protein HOW73_33395 [Polyangiaceae bacterium]|nr:hypothetical protein [Polyangiaceae bacterium]
MRRARPRADRALFEGGLGRPTLQAMLRSERGPVPYRRAVSIALDVADDLAEAEARASGPVDPLGPDNVLVANDRAIVVPSDAREGTLSPMWCPPAQVDGAPFDHAANRYVLGLMLYKMLTGSHPFGGGGGLRQALDAARTSDAAPFKAEVAEGLPPGLQALTLRLLHSDVSKRPETAESVADALSRFHLDAGGLGVGGVGAGALGGSALPPVAPVRANVTIAAGPISEQPTLPSQDYVRRNHPEARAPQQVKPRRAEGVAPAARASGTTRAWVRALLPIALGAACATAAVTQLQPPAKTTKTTATVGTVSPITERDLTAEDCASCHARQASEWRRSVMGHAVKSPLFNALESLIQEQVGRDFECPNGAGILRKTTAQLACRDRQTGLPVSGSGGEHWCVNCHAPSEVQEQAMPPWNGRGGGDPRSIFPVRDLIGERANEGISCGFCHQVHGPVNPQARTAYQGNPTWTSFQTGRVFESRPEDRTGVFGIANSGYDMQSASFLFGRSEAPVGPDGSQLAHRLPDEAQRRYLKSSEFCGSCHDVRLFGSDVIGAQQKGEHFKRLRNAYSEWRDWAAIERRQGREPATCQGCHMSEFPGVCEKDASSEGDSLCPPGTKWSKRAPGSFPEGRVASSSANATSITTHYLTGVDLPLSHEYPKDLLDEESLDVAGIPISAKARREALLKAAFDFQLGEPRLRGDRLEVPVVIENVGGGHRIPAGFSQEREIWVHLTVKDATGRVVYEVGRVDRADEDLRDKIFERVNTDPSFVDNQGRPQGLFGADVRDGPDHPQWSPPPDLGGSRFVGRGLINFQNGFLRCVTCIGTIAADGTCQPLPGQERRRADRFDDGVYDPDTGTCSSNLQGRNALLETYFPVGALDSTRGLPKAPDAIIDTRSMPPEVPITYAYDLQVGRARGPFSIKARLLFRAFPPFLVRAFAEYEAAMNRLGRRPSGPLVDPSMLERLEIVEVAKVERTAGVP